jgi:hypothetical protein
MAEKLPSVWTLVEDGVWSGAANGAELGRIETVGERFRAVDAQQSWYGDYPWLALAQETLERLHRV